MNDKINLNNFNIVDSVVLTIFILFAGTYGHLGQGLVIFFPIVILYMVLRDRILNILNINKEDNTNNEHNNNLDGFDDDEFNELNYDNNEKRE